MPNSLNFVSEFSTQAGRFKKTGKGHGTDKTDKTALDASAMAALTSQFSSTLQKVAQQQAEPAEKPAKINGASAKTETEQPKASENADNEAATTSETDTPEDTDQTDNQASETNRKPNGPTDFSLQVTALAGTMQTLLNSSQPTNTTPDPSKPDSLLTGQQPETTASAVGVTAGTLGIASIPFQPIQQNLPPATGAQNTISTAITEPVGAVEGPKPPATDMNQPGAIQPENSNFSQALEQAAEASANISTTSGGPATGAIDLTTIPSPASLPLPTPPNFPAKGETDGTHSADSPLPGLEVAAKGKTSTSGAANTNFLESVSSLSEKLQALNGQIEGLSEETRDDDAISGSDISEGSATPTQTDVSANAILAGINGAPGTTQPTQGQAQNPLNHFVSNAQQPADQVADGALYSIKNGQKELVIRLNPHNLGEVRINLISHGNQEMSARLIATTQESHDMLKSQIDSLKNTLESQGLQVERLSVVLAGSPESTRDFNHNSQQHQSFQQEQNTSQNNQQAFNQHSQPEHNLFNQLGGQFQHKQGFAQQPGGNSSFNGGNSALGEATGKAEGPTRSNENGNISLLA